MKPFVSILMPVRNEAGYIQRSLGAVFNQDYPSERVELIVVDGMSSDATRDLVQEMQSAHPNLVLLDNPGRIVPTGLNLAMRQARGEILLRVDGHCEIAADYLSNCVRHLQQDGVDGVGGSIETVGESYTAEAIALAMSSPFGVGDSAFRTRQGVSLLADTIPFPAYTRQAVELAGPYDEELLRNQDDEYNYRLRKLGYKLLLASDVRARYYSRSNLVSLWRQYFQYGYYKVRVLQKHPRQMRPRQFVPPLFVLGLGVTLLLALFTSVGWLLLGLLSGAYLLANLLASLWLAARRGWRYLPILPLAFATLHIAYGLGFMVGLLRFARCWGEQPGMPPTMVPPKQHG